MSGFRTLFIAFISGACALAQTIQLADGVFSVNGWRAGPEKKDWSAVFSVYTGTGTTTPMWGTYSVEGSVLRFRPQFPLAPGVHYRAVFRPPSGAAVEATFDGPSKPGIATTRVERVFPSAAVLPSNLLKLYILFSAPMSRGEALKRIHLLDENHRRIAGAFVEIDQELWDPTGRRLTVLFDPGRIKRDLVPNRQMGVPVVEGRRYILAIDREFLDARGMPLAEGFEKAFRGSSADRNPPDPKQWRIIVPPSSSRKPLVVQFPKPLDYALLKQTIDVVGAAGKVRGTITLEREETKFHFVPTDPWKSGAYKLAIDTTLEDLAGNRIGRPFDRNEGERSLAPTGKVLVPFEISR